MKIENNMTLHQQTKTMEAQKEQKNNHFKNILEKAFDQQDKAELKEACKQFESVFLSMTYKQMKATIPKSQFMQTSFARETFESMLDDEFSKRASEGQGIGLADMLYRQLSRQMDNTYKPSDKTSVAGKMPGDDGNNE